VTAPDCASAVVKAGKGPMHRITKLLNGRTILRSLRMMTYMDASRFCEINLPMMTLR
jgi:hypothetical protein